MVQNGQGADDPGCLSDHDRACVYYAPIQSCFRRKRKVRQTDCEKFTNMGASPVLNSKQVPQITFQRRTHVQIKLQLSCSSVPDFAVLEPSPSQSGSSQKRRGRDGSGRLV